MQTIKIGDKFESNNCGVFEVVKYNGAKNVIVKFIGTGTEVVTQTDNIKNGKIKDKLYPSVCNIGFLGSGNHAPRVNGERTQKHITWENMLKRCYSTKLQEKYPTYIGCSVSKDWHNFQIFGDWFDENYVEGYHLDKDILSGGNKVYSPDKCTFVTAQLNNLIHRGYKNGVTKVKSGNWQAQISINGIKKYLGLFQTKNEAINTYTTAKGNEIIRQSMLSTTNEKLRQPLIKLGIVLLEDNKSYANQLREEPK